MNTLPPGVDDILGYLAESARAYDNKMKWNEEAKLKADLMNVPRRWVGVSVERIVGRCEQLGMEAEDVALIKDLITRAQAGRRLVPQQGYRDFRFATPIDPAEPQEPQKPLRTSREW